MKRSLFNLLALASLLVPAFAACGDDDGSEPEPPAGPPSIRIGAFYGADNARLERGDENPIDVCDARFAVEIDSPPNWTLRPPGRCGATAQCGHVSVSLDPTEDDLTPPAVLLDRPHLRPGQRREHRREALFRDLGIDRREPLIVQRELAQREPRQQVCRHPDMRPRAEHRVGPHRLRRRLDDLGRRDRLGRPRPRARTPTDKNTPRHPRHPHASLLSRTRRPTGETRRSFARGPASRPPRQRRSVLATPW